MKSQNFKNIVIVGASGGIDAALLQQYADMFTTEKIFAFSRFPPGKPVSHNSEKIIHAYLDLEQVDSIQQMGELLSGQTLDLVVVCSGLLHSETLRPEKSLREIKIENLQQLFQINAFAPLLIAQQLLPLLRKNTPSVFAALSARVSSISDNRLGGWYGYRASKASLNMFIKTAAVEWQRRNTHTCIVGLHPGTVDTALSRPFQRGVPDNKLFSTEQSPRYLVDVISGLTPEHSGRLFAWDGTEVMP
jgi:NAD(P)-dependent dehydrogenase (short-subunit alcohol dehydrogenase family)